MYRFSFFDPTHNQLENTVKYLFFRNAIRTLSCFSLVIVFIFPSIRVNAHSASNHAPKNTAAPEGGHAWISGMGYLHGEISVTRSDDILVSTEVPGHGIMVYSRDGEYKHSIPGAPSDLHGFLIKEENGIEYIYGTSLRGQSIIKMTLDGERVLEVVATRIPHKFYNTDPKRNEIYLTGIAVDTNGDMFVIDGYGLDYIHKFDANGKYTGSFGGRDAPYSFSNCHKIFIDPRYAENRLMCTDRYHKRLVHLKMDGSIIGNYATELRRPSSVAFYKEYAAVAEIAGRVSILDKSGIIVAVLSVNDAEKEIDTPHTPPEKWKENTVTSPHGIAFDSKGNLYVSEWNFVGRVLKFDANIIQKAIDKR